VSGTNLYAAGNFTTVGSVSAYGIVRWDGSAWSVLGSGMNGDVNALAVSGANLYAGGDFIMAGGKVSAYFAMAQLVSPLGGLASSIGVSAGAATIECNGNPGSVFDVQRANNLDLPIYWTTLTTSPLSPATDGSFSFTDTNAPPGQAYYRLVQH
jgi:hypothetical protein